MSAAGFESRAQYYRALDVEFAACTRFFGAAEWTNRVFATLAHAPPALVSRDTCGFLQGLGDYLSQMNAGWARDIREGSLNRTSLDRYLVRAEQAQAQGYCQALTATEARAWPRVRLELDSLLNGTHGAAFLARLYRHTDAYRRALAAVRGRSGAMLKFESHSDRVAVGDALIAALRAQAQPLTPADSAASTTVLCPA